MEKESTGIAIEEPNPCTVIENEPAFRDGEGRDWGLTKLEYFAGQALAGLAANPSNTGRTDGWFAREALAQAESMIESLNRREESE